MDYVLKVNENDIAIISKALGDMPFSTVAPLIGKLQAQVNEQNKPKDEAP